MIFKISRNLVLAAFAISVTVVGGAVAQEQDTGRLPLDDKLQLVQEQRQKTPPGFVNREFGVWMLAINGRPVPGCVVNLNKNSSRGFYTVGKRFKSRRCQQAFPENIALWELWRGQQITFRDRNCGRVITMRKSGGKWVGPGGLQLVRR